MVKFRFSEKATKIGAIYYVNVKTMRKIVLIFVSFSEKLNFNRSSTTKRGVRSKPLFIIPEFFCIFKMNLAMATLGLKEMRKYLWEGREKVLP